MAIQKSGIRKVIALLCTITVLVFVCQTIKTVQASASSPKIVFFQQYINNAWTH